MSIALPIITSEVYVSVHDIEERPDHAAFQEAIGAGDSSDVAASMSMRKISGIERITYHFSDWYSFRTYVGGVFQYFIILLAATLIVCSGKSVHEKAT